MTSVTSTSCSTNFFIGNLWLVSAELYCYVHMLHSILYCFALDIRQWDADCYFEIALFLSKKWRLSSRGLFWPLQTWKRILGSNWDKSLKSYPPAIHSRFYQRILLPPPPLSKRCLKLFSNVNIVYRSLKSQDYAQKPQWNCTFMNSASGEKWSPCTALIPPPPRQRSKVTFQNSWFTEISFALVQTRPFKDVNYIYWP